MIYSIKGWGLFVIECTNVKEIRVKNKALNIYLCESSQACTAVLLLVLIGHH